MKLTGNGRSESPSSTMVAQHFHRYGIVGQSRPVADMIRRIELVSATRSTVLITGETGTGKELVARAVHSCSAQRHMPFIKVNCAEFPRPSWNRSSSAMSEARSRTRLARRKGNSPWLTAAPSFLTKSER